MVKNLFVCIVIASVLPRCRMTPGFGHFDTNTTKLRRCLTGYMTDLQVWVGSDGSLTQHVDRRSSLDYAGNKNAVPRLRLELMGRDGDDKVRYLSLARCRLHKVPPIFLLEDARNRSLCSTLEYLTLYGNQFNSHLHSDYKFGVILNATDATEQFHVDKSRSDGPVIWSAALHIKFPKLRELDLRACSIQVIMSNVFINMPKLSALYLGENTIVQIDSNAFQGLNHLTHLDLSRNVNNEISYSPIFKDSTTSFRHLKNLQSLDLSFTKLIHNELSIFHSLSKKFEILSICETGLTALPPDTFANTSLELLDVSFNIDILSNSLALDSSKDTLKVLIANNVHLRDMRMFENFRQLKILKLANNEVDEVHPDVAETLENLEVLVLDNNRYKSWFTPVFNLMKNLKLLSLQRNNINLITEGMLNDFKSLVYVAISQNSFVCNCFAREMFDLAIVDSNVTVRLPSYESYRDKYTKPGQSRDDKIIRKSIVVQLNDYTNNTEESDEIIETASSCGSVQMCIVETSSFVLIDYNRADYICLLSMELKPVHISDVILCDAMRRDSQFGAVLQKGSLELLALAIIPIVAFFVLFFFYFYRKNLKYFMLSLRNSAIMSLINRNEVIDDDRIFDYNVFVSYCNEDREWVLDKFLPHVEKDCNISVCLHERDFQVGLSILENIVSCMDRSRSIMLVLSKQFLRSQWCQFEMHLAQHRLLETRREDLILVLLEEIPRGVRPNTLHYLMMTKTYIVWPKEKEHQENEFWRRLKKSITTLSRKQINTSLA